MNTCNYCGKLILWCTVENSGAKMPLDPAPSPDGTVVLVGHLGLCRVVTNAEPAARGQPTFVTHVATCVQYQTDRQTSMT